MPDNQSAIITIDKIETKMFDTGTQYRISAGGKIYKFYDKKKDGNDTVAYKQFKDMQIKPGSTVNIWFKEETKNYQGKDYQDRLISTFREAAGKPLPITQPVSNATVSSYKPIEEKDEKFWDKKAYKQCLWGYWVDKYAPKAFEARSADGTLGQAEMDLVWQVFNQIEKDADKRFATGWDKAVKTFGADDEPLPEPPPEIDLPF